MTGRALVVGDGRAAFVLPALRSLGRAGWSTGVAQPFPGLATDSRWCSRHHPVPLVEDGPDVWLEAVSAALTEGRYDVVFPADDIELLALSAARDRLPAVVPYPPHQAVVAAVDKLGLTRAAEAVGIGTPRTTEADPASVAAVTGGVVVKARLHWSPGTTVPERHQLVQLVTGPEQTLAAVESVRASGGEPILQEVVDGRLMAISLVLDRQGRPVVVSHQETERASVRRTSARARTVAPDLVLEAKVVDLLRSLDWWGPANLQFLRGPDGVPRLIDLNARFYGSLALAIAAGADLPAAWARVAMGGTTGAVSRALPGVRFQALDEDLLAVRAAGGPRGATLRMAARASAYGLRSAHSVWDPRDPGPALQRQRQRLSRLTGRALTAAAPTRGRR